ncbi:YceI family protein [Streptomyces hawaiiensis]|uniref:YceI family protein n=1 Tax=Streptomyces hawaiiensis TaxID=67305 RepID=UPI001586A3BD
MWWAAPVSGPSRAGACRGRARPGRAGSGRPRCRQTRNARRDAQLRSGVFLAADAHPLLIFTSTRVRQTGADGFEVTGDLTVRGVTRQVTVDVELTDAGHGPQSTFRAAFRGWTALDREDWDVQWGPRRGRPEGDAGVRRHGDTPVLTRAGARSGPPPRP